MDNSTNIVYRVEKLEEVQKEMQEEQNKKDNLLFDIKSGVATIAEELKSSNEKIDLKNQLLGKDMEAMKQRIEKLEANQKWLVTAIISEILSLIFGIIMIFINKGI